MNRHCAAAVLILFACVPGCAVDDAPPSGDDSARPVGRLVIVGGGLDDTNEDVYQAILVGRQGDGPLCVLPTASGSPASSMESAVETLATYAGSDAVRGIPVSTEDPALAEDSSTVADLASCSGFYFTGGSQSRIVDVFLPGRDTTAAYRALWGRWQEGAVVAGSSAGAAMMSRVMIAGGSSADAVAHGVAASDDVDGVHVRGGMGFFPHAMLDQHFLARGRIGRLVVAALATDSLPLGLGIDENTALVVDGESALVVGASGVVVVDGRDVQRTGPARGSGLRVSLAGAGDLVDLETFQVQRGGAKQPLPATVAAVARPEDPFARWAFLHLMVDLAASADGQAELSVDGAVLAVEEAEGFRGGPAGRGCCAHTLTGWGRLRCRGRTTFTPPRLDGRATIPAAPLNEDLVLGRRNGGV
jgi:cyanophycinase